MTDDRMKQGAQIRAEVLGQAHVSQQPIRASSRRLSRVEVEHCWGNVSVVPGPGAQNAEHAQSWHRFGRDRHEPR